MSIERKKKMKDIFIENGERKFKLVPNIAVDSLGQETVTVGVQEVAQAMIPGYEVKFLVDPAKILSGSEPIADFQNLVEGFAQKGTTKMSYKKTQQCTFKKRYSKINKKPT